MAAVPAVSLSYATKNDRLLAAFGLGEYCQHVESFDVGVVLAHVEAIGVRHEELVGVLRERLHQKRGDVRERIDGQLTGKPAR